MAETQKDLLKKSYNDYVTQLQKNKVSAQNAVASSTERAKALLDNRLKSQGINNSGAGLSQYTALANQQNANLASINQGYNTNYAQATQDYQNKLYDYQNSYNDQVSKQAVSLLPNMSSEDATNFMNSLKEDNDLTDDTKNYLDRYLQAINNSKALEEQEANEAKNSAYNSQVIKEAESLLGGMTNEEAQKYLKEIASREGITDDTKNYLTRYLGNINNERSSQVLQNAKNDMSNLATYDQVQQYINSLQGLTPEQVSELQNYANVIGADWKTDRDTYVDELSEIIDVMRKNDNTADTSKYYSAFQQLSSAKTQEEYNKLLKDLDIKSLVSGAGGNKQYLNDYSNLSKMKVGDSLPVQTLEYLVNLNFVQKEGNNYVTADGDKKYVFDNTGKLVSNGDKGAETEYEGKEPDISEAEIKSLKARLDLQIGKVMSNASLSSGLKKQLEMFPSKTEYNSDGKETGTLYKVGNTTYRINKLGVLERVK